MCRQFPVSPLFPCRSLPPSHISTECLDVGGAASGGKVRRHDDGWLRGSVCVGEKRAAARSFTKEGVNSDRAVLAWA